MCPAPHVFPEKLPIGNIVKHVVPGENADTSLYFSMVKVYI
jgi:hypothetical protein